MAQSHHGLRNVARVILGYVFGSLLVAFLFTYRSSNLNLGFVNLTNLSFYNSSIFWQYVLVVLMLALGQILASVLTLTVPNIVFFLLNSVIGGAILLLGIALIPSLNMIPNLNLPSPADASFALFWAEIVAPLLLVFDAIVYVVSRPFEKKVSVLVR
ncbi:MAG: hypothetical protein ACYCQJ_13035 [Nitrososphaerales archaeon]